MASGRGIFPRLLTAALAAAAVAVGAAAESGPEEPLVVLANLSPERPVVLEPVVLSLLVEHPRPQEVSTDAPGTPPWAKLERVKTEGRLVKGLSGREERWTVVEFVFRSELPQDFLIGAFEVRVPGKSAMVETILVRVKDAAALARSPERALRWIGLPSAFVAGRAEELSLLLEPALPGATCSVDLVEDAAVEILPAVAGDEEAGVVLRVRMTALKPPSVVLPSVRVSAGTGSWSTRPRSLSVAAAPEPPRRIPSGGEGAELPSGSPSEAAPPFPAAASFGIPLSRAEAAVAAARGAWAAGDFAAAIAVLRTAERDDAAGPLVRTLRVEAEGVLGLGPGPDEPWVPRRILSPAAAALLCAAAVFAAAAAVRSARGVTKRRGRGFLVAGAFAAAGAAAIVYAAAAPAAGGASVVLRACEGRRVPDGGGAVCASFPAGRSAKGLSAAGDWIYVATTDGAEGWVLSRDAVRY